MSSKAPHRLRQRQGYISPSTQLHSRTRMKKFILLKRSLDNSKNFPKLYIKNLQSFNFPPVVKTLSFSQPSSLSIAPTQTPADLPDLPSPLTPQPKTNRVTATPRRRLPQPNIPRSVTHCCVCWQPFTVKSPEFHCICGSIPCLDCLGYHTCRIWRQIATYHQLSSFLCFPSIIS